MERDLFTCFDHMQELALALEHPDTTCGFVAATALKPHGNASHLSMGLVYYLEDVVDKLAPPIDLHSNGTPLPATRKYTLVHTESVEDDMRVVRAWARMPPAPGPMPHMFNHYPGENKTHVSTRARELLRKHLAPEYELSERLESYARAVPLQFFKLKGSYRTQDQGEGHDAHGPRRQEWAR